MSPWQSSLTGRSLSGRALTLIALLGALVNPRLPSGEGPVDLYLLLDESASVTRAEREEAWREVAAQGASFAQGSRFSLIRFAGRSVPELTGIDSSSEDFRRLAGGSPPRSLSVEPDHSDLEQALRAALVSIDPQRQSLLVMASDGRETAGSVTELLRSGFPGSVAVRWRRPQATAAAGELWISELRMPDRAAAGELLPVTVVVQSDREKAALLRLSLNGGVVVEQALQLRPGPSTVVRELSIPDPGDHLVQASIEASEGGVVTSDSRSAAVQIAGSARILAIGERIEEAPVTLALRAGGWEVEGVTAANFHQLLLGNRDVILLDNLPAAALSEEDWRAIGRAVAREGKGLIVLGGSNSFGGGGYRNTYLESLLPVTSRSRRPQEPAAVLFVLDRSGSMDRGGHGEHGSRMAIAKRAIMAAADLLEPGDLTGLVVFDEQTEVVQPLVHHRDSDSWASLAGAQNPSGGTRLAPALSKAIEMLAASVQQQKLIVLISDGHVEPQADFTDIAEQLESEEIDLIALAIGWEEGESGVLSLLAGRNQGRLLPVLDLARLPRLLSDELLKRRSAVGEGPVTPLEQEPLGYGIPGIGSWPELDSYMVTHEKADARVHLVSPSGDPLLASRHLGSGRVVALPGGLGDWADAWIEWSGWGPFVGGLVEWVNGNRGDPGLFISGSDGELPLSLEMDVVGQDQSWDSESPASATVTDPSGDTTRPPLELTGPGRYRLTIPNARRGHYGVQLRVGERAARYALFHEPANELDRSPRHGAAMEAALARGDIRLWDENRPLAGIGDAPSRGNSRELLLLLSLLLYLATLVGERDIRLHLPRRAGHEKRSVWLRGMDTQIKRLRIRS